jgi:biopolymer transport protein ExbD
MRDILSTESDGLLAQMNTTPLIDVMLVLLVMLIMTIPPQTHAIKLDLPNGPPPPVYQPKPVVNEVEITSNGALLWNGSPINMSGLESELVLTQQMYPTPEVHLRPDPEARYGIVDDVLAMIKREHVQKFGFVGNERYLQR